MKKNKREFGAVSLEVGEIYFVVMFSDAEMTTPLIQTLRFIEKTGSVDQGEVALFNELSAEGTPLFFVRGDDVSHMVLDRAQLISTLKRGLYDPE